MAAASPPNESIFQPSASIPVPGSGKATKWKYMPTDVKFDPDVHLAIEEPLWKKRLSDFGYDDSLDGISEVAATAPFRLFTNEAVRLMRNDLLSEPVQESSVYSHDRAPYTVRGYAPDHSRFIYDAWRHPTVLEAISRAAGIDLVPVFDYEIAHTNIQLGSKGHAGVQDLTDIPTPPQVEGVLEASIYDDRPVDDWHYDCYPFVAVLMISDTTGMVGGETAVQSKDGSIQVVPGPEMGKVVIMQGSRIKHAALRARNCSERIAMVTSLRPRDPMVEDMSHLGNIFKVSDTSAIGYQWLVYRLKVLEERCRIQREQLEKAGKFDLNGVVKFGADQEKWIRTTVNELLG